MNKQGFQEKAQRILDFTRFLSPAYSGVKHSIMHILLIWYQQMDLDHTTEAKELFLDYLMLPRESSTSLFKSKSEKSINLSCSFLPRVHYEVKLVRQYIAQHFQDPSATIKPFNLYLQDDFLMDAVAKAKLSSGADELAWYPHLLHRDARSLQNRKEKTVICFLPCNKTYFELDEVITIDCCLKNVNTLIIKVIFSLAWQNSSRAHNSPKWLKGV